MVKVTNPGLTSSDKDKYLAAVKQHEKMEEAMIAKAAENAAIEKSTYKQNLNDKSDSKLNIKAENLTINEESLSRISLNTTESHDSENEKLKEDVELEERTSTAESENKVTNISENSEDIIIDVDSMETESDDKDNRTMSESLENIKREQYDVKMVEDSKLESSNEIKVENSASISANIQLTEEQPLILNNKESLEGIQVTSNDDKNVKIQISVDNGDCGKGVTIPRSVASTDVTKPLTIETKFGGPSGPSSESTDTASEGGSCFSSPNTNSCQNSPQFSNGESTGNITGALYGNCVLLTFKQDYPFLSLSLLTL
jgi:hypothetical protein